MLSPSLFRARKRMDRRTVPAPVRKLILGGLQHSAADRHLRRAVLDQPHRFLRRARRKLNRDIVEVGLARLGEGRRKVSMREQEEFVQRFAPARLDRERRPTSMPSNCTTRRSSTRHRSGRPSALRSTFRSHRGAHDWRIRALRPSAAAADRRSPAPPRRRSAPAGLR